MYGRKEIRSSLRGEEKEKNQCSHLVQSIITQKRKLAYLDIPTKEKQMERHRRDRVYA